MLIGIYRIVNRINGKCYIGQSINIERRFANHKSSAHYQKNGSHLYEDIRKYGVDNFAFEILDVCTKEELDFKEKLYIAAFDSTDPSLGYNSNPGGQNLSVEQLEERSRRLSETKTGKKIGPPSKEALARRSAALKGIPRTEQWLKRMSESLKGREITPEARAKISATLKGSKLSEETKEKLRTASTGRVQTEEARRKISQKVSKRICQLDSDGNTIAVFDNARAATAEKGINFTNISSCCNGSRKRAGGFGWKFYSE